ncbi:MAG: hypothetical protein HY370_03755 [Proteobacteria bacterium]|nr:hypothetical protein [Pseudomonadota bacterium]
MGTAQAHFSNIQVVYGGIDHLISIEAIIGTSADDLLIGGLGSETFQGGKGNDVVDFGGGNNTYIYNLGDGNDTIIGDFSPSDTFRFGPGIAIETVDIRFEGDDLIYEMPDGAILTFKDFALNDTPSTDTLNFGDGTSCAADAAMMSYTAAAEGIRSCSSAMPSAKAWIRLKISTNTRTLWISVIFLQITIR